MAITSLTQEVKQKVAQLSIKAWKYHIHDMDNIQSEWLFQMKKDPKAIAIIEETGKEISNLKLLSIVLYLNKKLHSTIKKQDHIGILLPTTPAAIITNLSLLSLGKVIVNLNYTLGESVLKSAIEQAGIVTIISSRQLISKLKAKGFEVARLSTINTILYIEDLLPPPTWIMIIYLYFAKILPTSLLSLFFLKHSEINSTAAILFSSGSESAPKGVRLTHANILSNITQVANVFGMVDGDIMMNALPLFHAFGLTITSLMPILKGVGLICYPDPTNCLQIAKLICKYKATLFCSTSSLLGLFVRHPSIPPQMLHSLRMVVAGAEKLSASVYKEFKEKFNLEIYEGYGATEVAPVASCNLPNVISTEDWHLQQLSKVGTVGLPLPGCVFRVVDPNTLEDLPIGEDGLILIGGTQVMEGYLNLPDKTKEVLIPEDNYTWYKTGDKGHLDKDGFLTIIDRYSRFAKIAGELISLSQVEESWQLHLRNDVLEIMALNIHHATKGEQLAMLYASNISEENIKNQLYHSSIPKILLPKFIKQVPELPKLGNGKRDYLSAKKLLEGLIFGS